MKKTIEEMSSKDIVNFCNEHPSCEKCPLQLKIKLGNKKVVDFCVFGVFDKEFLDMMKKISVEVGENKQ